MRITTQITLQGGQMKLSNKDLENVFRINYENSALTIDEVRKSFAVAAAKENYEKNRTAWVDDAKQEEYYLDDLMELENEQEG